MGGGGDQLEPPEWGHPPSAPPPSAPGPSGSVPGGAPRAAPPPLRGEPLGLPEVSVRPPFFTTRGLSRPRPRINPGRAPRPPLA